MRAVSSRRKNTIPSLTSHYSHCLVLPVRDIICEREIKHTGKTVENQIKQILKYLSVVLTLKKKKKKLCVS